MSRKLLGLTVLVTVFMAAPAATMAHGLDENLPSVQPVSPP